jgi:hypothetical protein
MIREDPIVKAVRKARNRHAKKFGYKLRDICADLKKIEKQSGCRVVKAPFFAMKKEKK